MKPEIIVSANIGCIAHLQSGTETSAKHGVEMLDEARAVVSTPRRSAAPCKHRPGQGTDKLAAFDAMGWLPAMPTPIHSGQISPNIDRCQHRRPWLAFEWYGDYQRSFIGDSHADQLVIELTFLTWVTDWWRNSMTTFKQFTAAVIAALAVAMPSINANAQRPERTGKEVVDTACAACHAKGEKGAPRIGDQQAWARRAAQGLTALTAHALAGIRNMPAHGGNPGLNDIEVERAIIYMVNKSGGHWVEPLGGATPAQARQSQQIVQTQCAKCHKDGLNGAPKIGDRAAWVPRMANGLDALVKSAIHGRGAMPSRGGMADLTDQELRDAAIYMFNYGIGTVPSAPKAATETANPNRKVGDGR